MSSTSKSVERAFDIFALFEKERSGLSTQDIAETLGAPRSSTAALLKTLTDLKLLSIDRRTQTYFPTARFAQLGAWLVDGSAFPTILMETLESLRDKTGETVTLAAYQDLHMELVHVESSGQAISFRAEKGQTFPIWGTGVGTAFLASIDTQQIRNLYRRAHDRKLLDAKEMPIERVLEAVARCRETAYYIAEGAVFTDATAISIPTKMKLAGRPLVISITGPTIRMKPSFDTFGTYLIDAASLLSE